MNINLGGLLKPLLQSALDAAMPTIKARLKSVLLIAAAKDGRLDDATKSLFIAIMNAAVDGWVIKL